MSQMEWKYVKPIPVPFIPVNLVVASNDDVLTAIAKLQGQINAKK